MAAPLVCDALWAVIEPLIPPEPPKPKGGPHQHPVPTPQRHTLEDAFGQDGLRLRPLPLGPAPPRHHAPDRPAQGRRKPAPGPAQVGGRADARVVQPLSPPRRPLRAPRRHLLSLSPSRRQPRLVALRPKIARLSAFILRQVS